MKDSKSKITRKCNLRGCLAIFALILCCAGCNSNDGSSSVNDDDDAVTTPPPASTDETDTQSPQTINPDLLSAINGLNLPTSYSSDG